MMVVDEEEMGRWSRRIGLSRKVAGSRQKLGHGSEIQRSLEISGAILA